MWEGNGLQNHLRKTIEDGSPVSGSSPRLPRPSCPRTQSSTATCWSFAGKTPSQGLLSRPVRPDSATLWTAAPQASLSLTISRSLPKFMSIASVMPPSHLILWRPLLPSIFPSIRDFSSESAGPPISRSHPYPHTQSNTATCWISAGKTPFPLAGDL